MQTRTITLAVLVVIMASTTATTHHSQAMYVANKEVSVPGAVSKFIWKNPHSWLYVDAIEQGQNFTWEFEALSPNSMTRAGWKRDMIKVGDRVTAVGNPHRDGKKQARLVRIIMPDGRVLLPGQDPAYAKPGSSVR